MNSGWRRLGITISIAWIMGVSCYALYEWQAPFYKKFLFFTVIPTPEALDVNGAIPVTTPFRLDRFTVSIVLPVTGLWILLLTAPAIVWIRNGFRG